MKIQLLVVSLFIVMPLASQAAGNRQLRCKSKNAELGYHTVMYGEVAVGDYTVLNGQRTNFSPETQRGGREGASLVFLSQNRIFRLASPDDDAPLIFTLEAQLFGDRPTVLESGVCIEVPRRLGAPGTISRKNFATPHEISITCENVDSKLRLIGLGPDLQNPAPHEGYFVYKNSDGTEMRQSFVYPYTKFSRIEGSAEEYALPLTDFSLPNRKNLRLVIKGLFSDKPQYRLEYFYRDFIQLTAGKCF